VSAYNFKSILGDDNMNIEVIALTVEDVIQAGESGADRIELCKSISEDGLTPSYELITSAIKVAKIPVNVMVRPHNKSYVYNEEDIRQMQKDITYIREIGANGVVLGPLTANGKIDEIVLKKLLHTAKELHVTFHRAFDFTSNQQEALETLLQYKEIKTILTSGGSGTAFSNREVLRDLIEQTKGTHLDIMPGSGLRIEGLADFQEVVQANSLHFGTGVRVDNDYENDISNSLIERVRKVTKGIV